MRLGHVDFLDGVVPDDVTSSGSDITSVGLYDVATVAEILPQESEEIDLSTLKLTDYSLKSTNNERFLALACSTELVSFTISSTLEYDVTLRLDDTINDVLLLGNSCFLVAALANNTIVILSLAKQEVFYRESVPFNVNFLSSHTNSESCVLVIGGTEGQIVEIRVPVDVASGEQENQIEKLTIEDTAKYFKEKMLANVHQRVATCSSTYSSAVAVGCGLITSLCAVSQSGAQFLCNDYISSSFLEFGGWTRWIRVRDAGRFALGLAVDGCVYAFDSVSLAFVNKIDLKRNENDEILDFALIDKSMFDLPSVYSLVVKNGDNIEMHLLNVDDRETKLSVPCSSLTSSLACGDHDRVVIMIEQKGNEFASSKIVIREVKQTHPEMGLETLLKRCRFDEAEVFAKKYGLNVQNVYTRRVNHLLSERNVDDNDIDYAELIKTFDLIEDHNFVGESCVALIVMSSIFARIHSYLVYAKKRKITDIETLNHLEDAASIIATFRIVEGPVPTPDTVASHSWNFFANALHGYDDWMGLYLFFIEHAAISEARVVWQRHGDKIRSDLLSEGDDQLAVSQFESLFQSLSIAVSNDIKCWKEVVEHASVDVFCGCIQRSEHIVPLLEKLLVTVIELVEIRDGANFPQNAMHAASTLDRLVRMITEDTVTPAQQAVLAFCGRVLCYEDSRKSSPVTRMKTIYYDLEAIRRLKETYECALRYSAYKELSTEEICHRILQHALDNPKATRERIEKFVKPYMAEHSLNQDRTIFAYITSMAAMSHENSIIGWEQRCVMLCSSLEDEDRKCAAVVAIADASRLPWPATLTEAVNKVLNSRTLSKADIEKMRNVCHKAELSQLLAEYAMGRNFATVVCKNRDELTTLVRCILEKKEQPNRARDAVKMVELCELVIGGDWKAAMQPELIYGLIMIHMVRNGDSVKEIIDAIEGTPSEVRDKVVNVVLDYIASVADTHFHVTPESTEERARVLGVGESLVAYFSRREDDDKMRSLRRQLQRLRDVQKENTCSVLLSDLSSQEWHMKQFRRLFAKDLPIKKLIVECSRKGIPVERTLTFLFAKTVNNNNVMKVVEVFVEAVTSFSSIAVDLIDTCVEGLGWILSNLPNVSSNATQIDKADDLALIVGDLSSAIPKLLARVEFDSPGFEFLIQAECYISFYQRLVSQCIRGKLDEERQKQSAGRPLTDVVDDSEENSRVEVYSRRNGFYTYKDDAALFSCVEGVLSVADVAPSVSRCYATSTDDATLAEQRDKWEHLFNFLSMNSQDFLEISFRSFANTLQCWRGDWRAVCSDISQPVQSVCERALQQHPCDFWLVANLLNSLDSETLNKKLLVLRQFVAQRKSAQTFINYLIVAFFFSLLNNIRDMDQMLCSAYEQKWWTKRLAKDGVHASISAKSDLDSILQQAAELAKPLSPTRLFGFLKDACQMAQRRASPSELMVRYAVMMIRKASAVGNSVESHARRNAIDQYLFVADDALRLSCEGGETHPQTYAYLVGALYMLCPYNYEVIEYVVRRLTELAVTENDREFCANCHTLLMALWGYKRASHVCREESVWYTLREKKLAQEEKDFSKGNSIDGPLGSALCAVYENRLDEAPSSTSLTSSTDIPIPALVYEKNDVVVADMPVLACNRIPFHILLFRRKDDVDMHVMPLVKAEISIFNVCVWQHMLHHVSWLRTRFSRTHLLSTAIFTRASNAAAKEESLSQVERSAIYTLLDSKTLRTMVIATIAMLFRKIALSDVKIELLRMGVQLAEKWVNQEDLDPPMNDHERATVSEQCLRLRDGIAKFVTELALKRHKLYTEKTAELIEKPEELCTLIYEEMVDWDNPIDIDLKKKMVEAIAEANGINLTTMNEKLLMQWIGSETVTTTAHVDMNDTMGDMSMDCGSTVPVEDDVSVRLCLFDSHVAKMTAVAQCLPRNRLMRQLVHIFAKAQKEMQVDGGHAAVVRSICVMLRMCAEEELVEANLSLAAICSEIEDQQYLRLIEATNYDINKQAFAETDKLSILKALLQSSHRSAATTLAAACLMIDFDYSEARSIEQVMARLQNYKLWGPLRALLEHCKRQDVHRAIRSLPTLWFRAFERAITESNVADTASRGVVVRKNIFWLMRCPVEGGWQIQIAHMLRSISCPVAASVVSVLGSFTIPAMEEVRGARDELLDMQASWMETSQI